MKEAAAAGAISGNVLKDASCGFAAFGGDGYQENHTFCGALSPHGVGVGTDTACGMREDCLGCRVRAKFLCPLDTKQLCKSSSCTIDPALNSSHRACANRGSFLIGKTCGCYEDQRFTWFGRKHVDRFAKILHIDVAILARRDA